MSTDTASRTLVVYDLTDPQTMASAYRVVLDLAEKHGEITVRHGGPSRKQKVNVEACDS